MNEGNNWAMESRRETACGVRTCELCGMIKKQRQDCGPLVMNGEGTVIPRHEEDVIVVAMALKIVNKTFIFDERRDDF